MSTITINPAAGPARPRPGTAAARLVSAEFLRSANAAASLP